MTLYLLDTDHLTILQRKRGADYQRLSVRMNRHPPTVFFASVVSFHEQVLGFNAILQRSGSRAETLFAYSLFESILRDYVELHVLPIDDQAFDAFERIRPACRRVGTNDLLIGSIGLSRGMVLLTRNTIDFERIPGLMIEDWLADDEVSGTK